MQLLLMCILFFLSGKFTGYSLWSLYFQEDNIRNQRENVVLTIANAQARLGIPADADPVSVADDPSYYYIFSA